MTTDWNGVYVRYYYYEGTANAPDNGLFAIGSRAECLEAVERMNSLPYPELRHGEYATPKYWVRRLRLGRYPARTAPECYMASDVAAGEVPRG